jgi:hypothetical protein
MPPGDSQITRVPEEAATEAARRVKHVIPNWFPDLMDHFTAAVNTHDLVLVTDIAVGSTAPPDSVRYHGRDAVRRIWGSCAYLDSTGPSFTGFCAGPSTGPQPSRRKIRPGSH